MPYDKKYILLISIFFLIFFSSSVSASQICEMEFVIYANDTVDLSYTIAYEGKPYNDTLNESIYILRLTSTSLNQSFHLPVIFYIPHIGPSNVTMVSIPVECRDWNNITIEKNGTVIHSQDISTLFCNHNDVCQENENYVSCPNDCPTSGEDGICNRVEDNICDPDCITGDPDCEEFKQKILELEEARQPIICNNNSICELYENETNCPKDCEKEIIEENITEVIEKEEVVEKEVVPSEKIKEVKPKEKIFSILIVIISILLFIFITILFWIKKKQTAL